MREIFFGTPAVILWSLLAAIFTFAGSYAALVWSQVGGLRGLALVVNAFTVAIVCAGFALLLSATSAISTETVGVIVTTAFYPLVFSTLVLVDIYAADHNDHRSITTITYLWFKRNFSRSAERNLRNE